VPAFLKNIQGLKSANFRFSKRKFGQLKITFAKYSKSSIYSKIFFSSLHHHPLSTQKNPLWPPLRNAGSILFNFEIPLSDLAWAIAPPTSGPPLKEII
jgi:hypothetical protein